MENENHLNMSFPTGLGQAAINGFAGHVVGKAVPVSAVPVSALPVSSVAGLTAALVATVVYHHVLENAASPEVAFNTLNPEGSSNQEPIIPRGRPPKAGEARENQKIAKRISVSFTQKTSEKLEEIAKSQGTSIGEAVRQSVARDLYLQEKQGEGCKLILQDRNGQMHELNQVQGEG